MSPTNRTAENPSGIQASASQYLSANYLSPVRFSSIGWQLNLSLDLDAENFLEIGSGNNLLNYLLRKNSKSVFSIDHNRDTHPEIQALLPNLPILDCAVDASLCFQVLEHIPYEQFLISLRELARVVHV